MRIVLIADFYWPYLGGVEQHVRTLGAALAQRGHTVTVVTLAKAGLPDDDHDGQVRVRRLASTTQRLPWLFSSTERPWAPPIADPAIVRQLRRVVNEERPHIVHGHDWLARSFLPLRRWSHRKFGTRYVSTLHYYTLSCARKNLMHVGPARAAEAPCDGPEFGKCIACASRHYGTITGPITALTNFAGAAAERRAASVTIAVSVATARGNRLDEHRDAVEIVPNFLSPARSGGESGVDEDEELLAQLPVGDFLMFVGDLRPMKGADVLLEAYSTLRNAPPLVLIGKSWPDTPPVPARLANDVLVFDRWPNSAVLKAWQRSSIGVVPSVWAEPFGIVVIEAMAAGRAVVASRVGGIADIIEDGRSGILVKPGDPHELRLALENLLADPARRDVLGEAARRRAEAFDAAVVIPAIEAAYLEVIRDEARAASTSA